MFKNKLFLKILIIKEILSPSQYEENIITNNGSNDPVEFAIKLPGTEGTVYLPVDLNFQRKHTIVF